MFGVKENAPHVQCGVVECLGSRLTLDGMAGILAGPKLAYISHPFIKTTTLQLKQQAS